MRHQDIGSEFIHFLHQKSLKLLLQLRSSYHTLKKVINGRQYSKKHFHSEIVLPGGSISMEKVNKSFFKMISVQ